MKRLIDTILNIFSIYIATPTAILAYGLTLIDIAEPNGEKFYGLAALLIIFLFYKIKHLLFEVAN